MSASTVNAPISQDDLLNLLKEIVSAVSCFTSDEIKEALRLVEEEGRHAMQVYLLDIMEKRYDD